LKLLIIPFGYTLSIACLKEYRWDELSLVNVTIFLNYPSYFCNPDSSGCHPRPCRGAGWDQTRRTWTG